MTPSPQKIVVAEKTKFMDPNKSIIQYVHRLKEATRYYKFGSKRCDYGG